MVVVPDLSPYEECMSKKKEPISFMHKFHCLFTHKRNVLQALSINIEEGEVE